MEIEIQKDLKRDYTNKSNKLSKNGERMSITPASRTKNIVYAIRNIVTYAKKLERNGLNVTYLNIGDPIVYDFDVPSHMVEAAHESMKNGMNGYASSYGVQAAVEAIVEDEISKGKKVTTDDVIVTAGASEGIEIALTALLNEGENVLLPVPGYPLYDAVVSKIGAESKGYHLDPKNNWQPDLNDIEKLIDDKTKAIVVINPNNPTGVFYDEKTLRGIVDICEKHNLIFLSDEIYDKLLYDDNNMLYPSVFSKNVPIISFNGLSKNYVAPGWRIGWMVFQNMENEKEYIAAIRRIAEARLCSCAPLQGAIAPALLGDQSHIDEMLVKLQKRRDITFDRLNAMDRVTCVKPQATFYAMAQVDGIEDDEAFVKDLLKETGVLFVHGSGFGMAKNQGTFRIVFLPEEKTLHEAFDKLEAFLKKY